MTGLPLSWLFTVVGFYQMSEWAVQKHRNYLKQFGDEYKKLNRKAIVPFVY
jgi:very-long-chain enoyl-CoA reductase